MDLLELLDAQTDNSDTHALMPCMALACGIYDVKASRRRREVGGPQYASTQTADVTCPECLKAYGGVEGIRIEMRRQQGHQQQVATPTKTEEGNNRRESMLEHIADVYNALDRLPGVSARVARDAVQEAGYRLEATGPSADGQPMVTDN